MKAEDFCSEFARLVVIRKELKRRGWEEEYHQYDQQFRALATEYPDMFSAFVGTHFENNGIGERDRFIGLFKRNLNFLRDRGEDAFIRKIGFLEARGVHEPDGLSE